MDLGVLPTAAQALGLIAAGVLGALIGYEWASLVTLFIVIANFTLHYIEHHIIKAQRAKPHAADGSRVDSGGDWI